MKVQFEKGQKCRLQGLEQKALNGKKVKVVSVSKDDIIVKALDGSNTKYSVEADNLRRIKKAPPVEAAVDESEELELETVEEETVDLDEEPEEVFEESPVGIEEPDPLGIGTFHRLQNCKKDELNKTLVVIAELLEDGRFLVQDKHGNKYKVSESKLKPSVKSFPFGMPEEPAAEEEEDQQEVLTIDELIASGHTSYILDGCKNEELNGKLVKLLGVVDEDRVRVEIDAEGTELHKKVLPKMLKEKLVPVELKLSPEEEEAVAAISGGDEEGLDGDTKSAIEGLVGRIPALDRLQRYMDVIAGIPYIELENIITAYKEGRYVIEEPPAENAADSGETDEELFRRLAPTVGLDPDLYHSIITAPFTTGARDFRIERINPNAKKSPVEAVDTEGNRFWFQVDYVTKCIDKMTEAAPVAEVHQIEVGKEVV